MKTLVDDEATVGEKALARFFLLPIGKFGKAGKLVKEYDGFKVTSKGEVPAKKSGSANKSTSNPNKTYKRPSGFRKGVKDEVWEKAKSSDGNVKDPVSDIIMKKMSLGIWGINLVMNLESINKVQWKEEYLGNNF